MRQQQQQQQFSEQQLQDFVEELNSRDTDGSLLTFFRKLPEKEQIWLIRAGAVGVRSLEYQFNESKKQQPTPQQPDQQVIAMRRQKRDELITALFHKDRSGKLLAFFKTLSPQLQASLMLDGATGALAVQAMFQAEEARKAEEEQKHEAERKKREAKSNEREEQLNNTLAIGYIIAALIKDSGDDILADIRERVNQFDSDCKAAAEKIRKRRRFFLR